MLYKFYYTLTLLLSPLLPLWSKHRLRAHKEHPQRWREKLGCYTPQGWTQRPVWIHAVSVGEFNAALPLIMALQHSGYTVLVSTSTRTSADLAAVMLPPNVHHVFAPWDAPHAVRAFLNTHRPCCGVLIDSELWPNLLLHTAAAGVPLVLANARMSAASLRRRMWLRGLYKKCLQSFTVVFAPDIMTAQHFKTLGAQAVAVIGSLKNVASPHQPDDILVQHLQAYQPWTAMSLHEGDIALVLQTISLLPQRLCIAVPRHMSLVPLLQQQADALGIAWALRSEHATPPANTQLYIADTMGESATWYSASRAAYIGKSTTAQHAGGHNPIEAIRFGCVPLHGQYTQNFAHEYESLQQNNASLCVGTPDELRALLQNYTQITTMQHNGARWLAQQNNPLPVLLNVITQLVGLNGGAIGRSGTAGKSTRG
jgi:3-deoxy-D-manno-octulosonic-acid transferase